MNANLIIFKLIFLVLYIFATYVWIHAANNYLLYKNHTRKCINITLCIIYIITSSGVFVSYFFGTQIFLATCIIYSISAFAISTFLHIITKTTNDYVLIE